MSAWKLVEAVADQTPVVVPETKEGVANSQSDSRNGSK